MAIDPNIKKKANDIRNKVYGKEVRESLASGLEEMSSDVVETVGRQDEVEGQWQNVVDETTGKDVISAPEIIAARDGEANLKARLDKEHQKVAAQLAHIVLDITNFGAIGDGVHDDRLAIQLAADEARGLGGGDVLIPYAKNFWNIASVGENNCAINVPRGVNITGAGNHYGKNRLQVTTDETMKSVFNLLSSQGSHNWKNLFIDCNNKAEHGITTNGTWVPYLNFQDIQILNPISELGVNIQTFMSSFKRVGVQGGSLRFFGSRNNNIKGTSVNVENCYGTDIESDHGGIILDFLTYSKISVSGVDRGMVGYELVGTDSITLDTNGTEHCLIPYRLTDARNTKITMPSVVSTLPETHAIFELHNSVGVTLGRLDVNDLNWDYHVRMTGNTSRVIYEDSSINSTDNQSTVVGRFRAPQEMQYAANSIQKKYLKAGLTSMVTGEIEFKLNDVGIVSIKGNLIPTRTIEGLERLSTIIEGYRPSVNTLIPILDINLGGQIGFLTLNANGGLVVEKNTILREGRSYAFNFSFERDF